MLQTTERQTTDGRTTTLRIHWTRLLRNANTSRFLINPKTPVNNITHNNSCNELQRHWFTWKKWIKFVVNFHVNSSVKSGVYRLHIVCHG